MARRPRHVQRARSDCRAQSLCADSCCTSCPPGSSAFATMGCWHPLAKRSSCQQHSWPCRCLRPTRKPLSRLKGSWCGWPRWMWACARVARWAGCAPSLCWLGLGDCLGRTASWRLTSAGRHDGFLPCIVQWTRFAGRLQAFGAVLRVVAPTRAHTICCAGRAASGVAIWPLELAFDATNVTSAVIICLGTRGAKLANPYAAHANRSRRRFSPTRFICRRRCS